MRLQSIVNSLSLGAAPVGHINVLVPKYLPHTLIHKTIFLSYTVYIIFTRVSTCNKKVIELCLE